VVANDLLVLAQTLPGRRHDPVCKPFVQVRPLLLRERGVGSVADEEVAEGKSRVATIRLHGANQLQPHELGQQRGIATEGHKRFT
jgi:hypothetical protein